MTRSLVKRPITEEKLAISGEQTRLLLESLRFDQINTRQMTIKKAHMKTCKWLFSKSEYLDWLDHAKLSEHHGFLWVKGKPGTGKSTLMKYLLANARKLMKAKVVISFFFNARGDDLEKSTLGTYQSLLLQLLERLPTLQSVFETLDTSVRPNGGAYQWSADSLKTLLEEAILRLGGTSVVCLIDALDECDERQIRDMISFLEHVGRLTESANISFQVCFSSRHYPHITIENGIILVLEGQEGHTQDITSYLESELKIGNSKVAKQVRSEIQEKASGVFLWVVLVVEILNKEHDSGRIPALRRRLREIPGDLHELFNDILTRDSRNRDELILCVQWVLFARHPLTPEQLYFAIIAGTEPQDLSMWDPEEMSISDIQRFILNASKGLAETTASKTPKVQFIHESVKDFLVKENGLGRIWPDLGSNFEGQSHERLKECCATYLTMDFATDMEIGMDLPKAFSEEAVKLRNSVTVKLPFLEFATNHVLYHADKAEGLGVAQESFLQNFQLHHWIWLNNLFEKHQVRRHTPKTDLLYILAEYDMPNLIRMHPSVLSLFETGDERYGCPMFAALATGSDRAVRSFLQACVASQPPGSRLQQLYQQFLQTEGQKSRVGRDFQFSKQRGIFSYIIEWRDKMLFAFVCEIIGLNLDTKSTKGRTLLSMSAEIGDEYFAKLLLDDKADVDSRDAEDRTPLTLAAELGHETIVRLLLESGVTVDPQSRFNLTPLLRAASSGHETIVRLLLEAGATVDPPNMYGETPLILTASSYREHEPVVKLLLENNAAVERKDRNGKTALALAVLRGHDAMVKLLLETGKADINTSDEEGDTPLIIAVRQNHHILVKTLLDTNKVDVNSKNHESHTPLAIAIRNEYVNIVKWLLDTDNVDVNWKNFQDDTLLSLAIQNGLDSSHSIVKLLLDTGKVDVNWKNLQNDTLLSLAIRNGHDSIVKLLLDTGKVDVNWKSLLDDALLSLAIQSRLESSHSIVKLLLDTGKVEVNSKNFLGETPLHIAACLKNETTLKLLLDTGKVDVNSRNRYGETPLMLAVHHFDAVTCENVFTRLLDAGEVDVHAKNDAGETARTIAAANGKSAIVQLLDNYVKGYTRAFSLPNGLDIS